MFRISDYLPFLFLIFIPFLIYINRHSLSQTSKSRKFITLFYRTVAIICLILALTGLQFEKKSHLLSTIFILDVSDSVPKVEQRKAIDKMNRIIENLNDNDKYALNILGAESYVKIPLTLVSTKRKVNYDVIYSEEIDIKHTNLANALQLALSMFTGRKYKTRIVMFTDGIQNSGEVRNLFELVKTSKIEIFTIPLNSERKPELIVERLEAPDYIRIDNVFRLRGTIRSTDKMEAQIRLYRDDIIVESLKMEIKQGRQIVDFNQTLHEEGNFQYKLEAIPTEDSVIVNNIAYQNVTVKGKPKLLFVQNKSQAGNRLKKLLEKQIDIVLIDVSQLPNKFTELNAYDCIVLNNLHVNEIGVDRVNMLENYVRDNGKGLIVIGGTQSFGLGNYMDTALERTLPVEMTPKQKKGVLALILLIDKSGSMANYSKGYQKMQLAIAAARTAIKILDKKDLVGVLTFDAQTSEVVQLTQAQDKDNLLRKVGNIRAGSGTKMYPALEKAYQKIQNVNAKQKLVVILSDGKSSDGDFVSLAKKMANDKISISAIAIGDAARKLMQSIASAGNGRYIHVVDVSQLPRIVSSEIHQTQELLIENEFVPKIAEQHPILKGFDALPKLYGYVATAEKDTALNLIKSDSDEPILAVWNYGLGRAIAFTSNIETNWAANWIKWDKFGKFWLQNVNWVLPAPGSDKDLDLYVTNDSGIARVILEYSMNAEQSQIPEFIGRVSTPNEEGISLKFRRISFNRYEATFNVNQLGVYSITVKTLGEKENTYSTNLEVPYYPEYSKFQINTRLLRELADISKGEFLPETKKITERPEKSTKIFVNLSKWLILASIVIFVVELIFRRITLSRRLTEFAKGKIKSSETEISGNLNKSHSIQPLSKIDISSSEKKDMKETDLPLATRLLKTKEQKK